MAGLRDEVELDVAAALRDIDRLGAALTQQTQKFRKELASSLDTLRAGPRINNQPLDDAAKKVRRVTAEQHKLRQATDASTAATGKYGRAMQGIAQIRVVQGLVAFFGGRALVSQITATVAAASDLNEELTRASQVFGPASDAIEKFGDTAVESVALARGEAVRFANDFGTMFRGAGIAEKQAAELSQTFVQLGADIASFSNLDIQDALTKLSAGLAGEIEPLRRIGFGFNDLEVQAKATELGLRGANGELTEGAKLQARIAVITEKTTLAQGDLARTAGGLANQQRFLRAEAQQLREELGQKLIPVFLEVVRALREQLPAFSELATNLIPLVSASLRTALPILEAFLNVLVALTPIISVLATVIESMPQPLLQAAVAFGIFGTGLGPLPNLVSQFTRSWTTFASPGVMGSIIAGFRAMNPWVLGLTVALPFLSKVLGDHADQQRKAKAFIDATSQAFRDQAESVREDVDALAAARIEELGLNDDLREMGLTIADVTEAIRKGPAAVDALIASLGDFGDINNGPVAALAKGIAELSEALNDQAKAELDALVVSEKVSAALADEAVQRATAADGTVNYVAALAEVEPALAAALAETAALDFATAEATDSMSALDDALNTIGETLDRTLGRYVDAQRSTLDFQDAISSLAETAATGAEKGETFAAFQDRLAASTLDAAEAAKQWALDQAAAGRIGSDQASIQAAIRDRLIEVAKAVPEVAEQILIYIGVLDSVPVDVTTVAVFDYKKALADAQGWGSAVSVIADAARDAVARATKPGEHEARRPTTPGLGLDVDAAADAGRAAGRAAADAAADEVALRLSGANGLNLSGFIVEGIQLGARQAEIDIRNFVNGTTQGLQGIVADAMKIDQAEASEILQAVAAMDQATLDLATAREELGANSIEAKVAELALADAQSTVNDLVADAIDSTEAYNEALQKVSDSIDTMTGSLRALQGVQDAQRAADEAGKVVKDEEARLALFDRLIGEQESALADATRRRIAAGGTEPSVEELRILDSIEDLTNRRIEQAKKVAEAVSEQQSAQLDLIDSTQNLLDLSAGIAAAQGMWEGLFRSIAAAAGLSAEAIDALVEKLKEAGSLVTNVSTGILTGQPVVLNSAAASPAKTFAAAGVAGGTSKVTYNTFHITEAQSGRGTAVEVVDEIRAVELVG